MLDFSQVLALPDIDFIDTSVNDLLAAGISAYESAYQEATGTAILLQPGDDDYILLRAAALKKYSTLQSFNAAMRQNFLKYAAGTNADHLAANSGCLRGSEEYAVVTMQFNLGQVQSISITIPMGTRVTPGNNLFFATDAEIVIPAGNTSATVKATCQTAGEVGNGYIPGTINTLVDTSGLGYVASVTNTDTSEGGTDTETDLKLRQDAFEAPETYSVAGPSGAYEALAKQYSSAIIDAKTTVPSACAVNLRVLMTGGTLPNEAFLTDLQNYLGADTRRPMTDSLTVAAPDTIAYNIALTYYIDSSDAGNAQTIQTAVNAAVQSYISWQQGALGRDIVPDRLTAAVINAGAKRVTITSPTFTQVADTAVAQIGTQNVTCGGVDNA